MPITPDELAQVGSAAERLLKFQEWDGSDNAEMDVYAYSDQHTRDSALILQVILHGPTPEQIEAAAKAVFGAVFSPSSCWDAIQEKPRDHYLKLAAAAIAAYRRSLGITTKGE